jgi:hypothetical protein
LAGWRTLHSSLHAAAAAAAAGAAARQHHVSAAKQCQLAQLIRLHSCNCRMLLVLLVSRCY